MPSLRRHAVLLLLVLTCALGTASVARGELPLGTQQKQQVMPATAGGLVTTADSAASASADGETAIRYSRTKLLLSLVEDCWSWLVLLGILVTGFAGRLRDWASALARRRWLAFALYLAAFGLLTSLLALPLGFYDGFVVEHQFGLSTEAVGGWIKDRVLEGALGFIVALPLLGALYWLIDRAPRRWWLAAAGLFIAISVVFAALFPLIVAPLFNSYEPLGNPDLERRLIALSESAGVHVAQVVKMDMSRRTVKANAFFEGIGPSRRIVLADTLVDRFTPAEIETVVAHELGHQAHEDVWRGIAVDAAFYLAAIYVLYRSLGPLVRRFGHRFGFSQVRDFASLPLLVLLFGLLSFVAMPVLNGYSRQVEHEADRYSLDVTGAGPTYAAALAKLGEINLADPAPPTWIVVVFYTHPPLAERIAFALSYAPQHQRSFGRYP